MANLNQRLIYFLLFLLPWQTRLILRPGLLNSAIWEYGHLGIFATEILLWLIIIWRWPRFFDQLRRQRIGLTLSASLAVFYLFTSADKWLTLQILAHYFAALSLFLILKDLSSAEKRLAIGAFVAGVTFQAILGIWQFLTQSTLGNHWLGLVAHPAWLAGTAVIENTAGRFLRAYGGLPHPNILGGYLVVSLMLLLTVFGRHYRPGLVWVLYFIQLSALFFTFSRGAWLALAVFLLIFLWQDQRPRWLAAAALVFVFYGWLFSPLLDSRLMGIGRLETISKNERLTQYSEAWSLVKQAPFFGTGPGLYTLAWHNLRPDQPVWALQPVHNIFVLALAEWGIVGLALLGLAIVPITKGALANTKVPLVIALVILGLFDHYLLSLWSGLILTATTLGLRK